MTVPNLASPCFGCGTPTDSAVAMHGNATEFFVTFYRGLGVPGQAAMNVINGSRLAAEAMREGVSDWTEVVKLCQSCVDKSGLAAAGAKPALLLPDAALAAFYLSDHYRLLMVEGNGSPNQA